MIQLRNIVINIVLTLFCTVSIFAQNSNCEENNTNVGKSNPVPFRKLLNYGFKDSKGEIIVPAIYKEVIDYRDGIAWVKDASSLWGSIDLNGNIIVENKYASITRIQPERYSDNICIAGWLPDDKGGYAEIIDYKTGKLLFNNKIERIWDGHNKEVPFFCCEDNNGKIHVLDKTNGSEIYTLPKGKTFAGYYNPFYIGVYNGKLKDDELSAPRYGIVDRYGKEIIKCENYEIRSLPGKFSHIVIVQPKKINEYDEIAYLYDLKLRRQIGGEYYSFYAHKGSWDCPLIVTTIHYGDMCLYGVLDLVTGKEVISPIENKYAELIKLPRTQHDPIVAQKRAGDSTYYLISLDGKERKMIGSDSYLFFVNGFSRYGDGGKIGIINADGEVVVDAEYDDIEPFEYNNAGVLRCKAVKNGKTYYLDTKGNIL